MKRRKRMAFLLAFLVAAFSAMHPYAAGGNAAPGGGTEEAAYLPLDCLPVLVRQSKDTLKLRFRANPATGYEWVLGIGEEEILSLYQKIYVQDPNPEGKDGVGGNTTFTLKGQKAGTTLLYFRYRQNIKGGDTACFCVLRVICGKGGEVLSVGVIRSGLKVGDRERN